ncbi:hypothetical protein CHS0354_007050 [Potamilus streckersoni]|uniref:Uncharacterized protein n=1 Tax=Potamilus streckersoni TaxID=2493646 RepID=A0AAE0VSY6_9BIVA|nr:hypothetical protein CHS0354_007050 [Potamilus streckersoni]
MAPDTPVAQYFIVSGLSQRPHHLGNGYGENQDQHFTGHPIDPPKPKEKQTIDYVAKLRLDDENNRAGSIQHQGNIQYGDQNYQLKMATTMKYLSNGWKTA